MSADTSPKEVAAFVRVLRQRARTGDFGAIELGDACDLIEALAADCAEWSESFNLRWKADQRAIAAWQAAAPGRELTWPNHADLCVWLLDERARLAELYEDADFRREVLSNALAARTAAEYPAAFAADAAARARLADERAAIHPTERDRRGVPVAPSFGDGA